MFITWSIVSGSSFDGSLPYSATYFSNKDLSKTHPETEETQGTCGISPETIEKNY